MITVNVSRHSGGLCRESSIVSSEKSGLGPARVKWPALLHAIRAAVSPCHSNNGERNALYRYKYSIVGCLELRGGESEDDEVEGPETPFENPRSAPLSPEEIERFWNAEATFIPPDTVSSRVLP